MNADCSSCYTPGADLVNFGINDDWYEVWLCATCAPRLGRCLMPLIRLASPVDAMRLHRFRRRMVRSKVEVGHVTALDRAPHAPLLMSLKVTDGIEDLKGHDVEASFTEAEIIALLAHLRQRPQWAHVIEAIATESVGETPAHPESITRHLQHVGSMAIAEARDWR